MKAGWIWVVVALAACSSPAGQTVAAPKETAGDTAAVAPVPAATPAPAEISANLILAAGGLSIAEKPGSKASLIKFGVPRASAEHMVGDVQGEPLGKGSSSECAAGTIDYTSYKGDLQLTFQEGKFIGWTVNSPESPLRTARGIGVGSTRQDLDAAYKTIVEDSSLGLLWGADDLVGTLDIDGIEGLVTGVWAGTVCLID